MGLLSLMGTGVRVLRTEGPRSFYYRFRKRLRDEVAGVSLSLPVKTADALAVDWMTHDQPWRSPILVEGGPITTAWIMSPPSENSGGHQNLFRFIHAAEQAGHRARIYFYTNSPVVVNVPDMRRMLSESTAYPHVEASMEMYDRDKGVADDVQALFATGWETAYPAFLDRSAARRFYFVQDFEPFFYPVGSESMLAENTYRFGFHAITAGGWLSHKLHADYGMPTDYFDFAVDHGMYRLTNREPRTEIFFYARPTTARRGFELGVMALAEFAKEKPDHVINFAGWDVARWDIPFAYKNLSGVNLGDLSDIYNRCAAGLVLSGTNMSLLPLEIMAAGVVPVVNDAPNNRMVSDNPFIEYVAPSPSLIARRLIDVVDRPDAVEHAVRMADSLSTVTWDTSRRQFVEALEKAMQGG